MPDVDLNAVRSWLEVTVVVAAAWLGAWRIGRKIERRLDSQDNTLERQGDSLSALKSEQAKQFGGNSNGIRQAVDGLTAGQRRMESRLDSHLQTHGETHN